MNDHLQYATRRLPAALLLAGLGLAACSPQEPKNTDPFATAARHPEPATRSSAPSSTASGIEPPLSAVVPADVAPAGKVGAEGSNSSSTGPANGSTAVGGAPKGQPGS